MKNKLAVYATMLTIGATTLVGCNSNPNNKKNINDKKEKVTRKIIYNYTDYKIKKGDSRTFLKNTHVFYKKQDCNESKKSINVPKGYKIFDIEESNYSTEYMIWYTNTQDVEVKAVYNKELGKYDYSDFGSVIVSQKLPVSVEINKVPKMKQKVKKK